MSYLIKRIIIVKSNSITRDHGDLIIQHTYTASKLHTVVYAYVYVYAYSLHTKELANLYTYNGG